MQSRFVNKITILILSVILLGMVAACEASPNEDPPTVPVAARVTTTLQPPLPLVTQTALFTATQTASMSPTPEDTATPSNTPSPQTPSPTASPTATATLSAAISEIGADNKRVREGPDAFDFEQVGSLPGGAEIGVLGFVINDRDETWYSITFFDEDGDLVSGWIRADLITIEDDSTIPELTFGTSTAVAEDTTVTPEEPAGPTPTPQPFVTATPENTPTPFPTGATVEPDSLSSVNVRAEPGDVGQCAATRVPNSNDSISIFWSWFVYDAELMQDHLNTVDYVILLNGQRLENWDRFRGTMFQDPLEDGNWTVYWYVPIGRLDAGEYTLEYQATWSEEISDGRDDFGPGTDNEIESGRCTFVVIAN